MLSLAIDPRRPEFVSQIKVLNLSKNILGKEGIKAIAKTLCYNQIIEIIDVSRNQIGVQGAIELAEALKENKSLKYLNIFNNNVGYDGAKFIGQKLLRHHPKL
jgi:Ran GTPase-activating protein (RanGAP) involved in mRNA processing and transport